MLQTRLALKQNVSLICIIMTKFQIPPQPTTIIFLNNDNNNNKNNNDNNNNNSYVCNCEAVITKTCLYNFDPFQPHFYVVKLGFTGVYIISFFFFFFAQKHKLWVFVRTALRGGYNQYPQSMF